MNSAKISDVGQVPLDIREVELDLLAPIRNDKRFTRIVNFIDDICQFGTVAGGFAAYMARINFSPTGGGSEVQISYARRNLINALFSNENRNFWNGDIDFFFENEEKLLKAKQYATEKYGYQFWKEDANSSAWNSFVYLGKIGNTQNMMKMQFIHQYFGDSRNIIENFDLINSMVGYRSQLSKDGTFKHTTWIHRNWKEYEDRRMLHVHSWHSPFILHRIYKYNRYKGYNDFSPHTIKGMSVVACTLAQKTAKEGRVFGCFVMEHIDKFNIEDFLKMSLLTIDMSNYGYIDKTFHDIMMEKIFQINKDSLDTFHKAS